MGLSSAIDWWDEWKLRILVLCSLSIQSFLFFSIDVRRLYNLRRLRVLVWIAYIGGDALAIYALAALFNHQKQQTKVDGGGALEVIWAPILLIHLGGQIQISAYSLEDNELWKRHVVTLVSQVTVALYVFCKWWSGQKGLLHAAVLLFIFGILKCGEKPWALQRASYGRINSYSSSPPQREGQKSSYLSRLVHFCTREISEKQLKENPRKGVIEEGIDSLEKYVQKAQEYVKEGQKISAEDQVEKFKEDEAHVSRDIYKMFLDLAAPYSVRLYFLQSFLNLDGKKQHQLLQQWIRGQFAAIYTRRRSVLTFLGVYTQLVLPILPLVALSDFNQSAKYYSCQKKKRPNCYNKSDITVTYILLSGTVVLELGPFFLGLLGLYLSRRWSKPQRQLSAQKKPYLLSWQSMIAQHNIVSFCARKKKPPTLMKLAASFSYLLSDYINRHWYWYIGRHQPRAKQISELVCRHAEGGWKEENIHDAATYRRFNNLRGEHTMMKMSHHLLEQDRLGWTFDLPFDEYVLVWHLATDICIHQTTDLCIHQTHDEASASEDTISSRCSSEIISNYMIYLLFICPDMLMHGTRQDLFMIACGDIEIMIKDEPPSWSPDKSSIAQRILRKQQGDDDLVMVPKAHKLARVLIDCLNGEDRWKVIQGVWVEMLCYSASKCRGYLHAKSLGVAGEFLTNVWLLWWCMGMQTLPDMMHNLGPPLERSRTNKCTQRVTASLEEEEEEITPAASV